LGKLFEVQQRIDGFVVSSDFEVEMGSGGSSGLANFPDDLTLLYGRSLLHQIPLIMRIDADKFL
jgi:hypothetical protein